MDSRRKVSCLSLRNSACSRLDMVRSLSAEEREVSQVRSLNRRWQYYGSDTGKGVPISGNCVTSGSSEEKRSQSF